MSAAVRRIFVEKRQGLDVEAKGLFFDLKENLGVSGLEGVKVLNRYHISGITDEEYARARSYVFAEPPVDRVYDEELQIGPGERAFAVEYLPGQFDQRADSAAQCVQILTQKERPLVTSATVYVLQGNISDEDFGRVKNYCINPIESREASLEKPHSLEMEAEVPGDVPVIDGFIDMAADKLPGLAGELDLAMDEDDLAFCQEYFRDKEKRDPTITEIRVLDTYWSDHCRHTTFYTAIDELHIEEAPLNSPLQEAYQEYLRSRHFVHGNEEGEKPICLMDIALIAMKEMKKKGMLPDLDESEEVNASSISVEIEVDGKKEEWLVMFKNETHNHPTEIEPFGGAATCLGGAIRDPLSGRSYVYHAMRVTGSGDPRARVEDTLPGKLPQRKITTGAAEGFSSYGNQIGLATGQVSEVYDEGFIAKRMEIGAVIGAAPRKNVVRKSPAPGDAVILVGGRTGRDGCGGATGSSKEHTLESLTTRGAEVQKGNPPTERKLQRLFRDPRASRLIKRCNDFGAGGVSVAIGELTDGVEVDLDTVPKKYEGLDGTELAISESQERMAVVVASQDVDAFIGLAGEENLEATVVARVTDKHRLKMFWRGKAIVDIDRDFLNSSGVQKHTRTAVAAPRPEENYFNSTPKEVSGKLPHIKEAWLANLRDLNVCSQKGLVERFDSTIGAASMLLPFGGKHQATPAEGMISRLPVLHGETYTATIMTHGYNPALSRWSPFHGALYAVVEAVAKVVALGGDYRGVRLTLQEYFEKLKDNPFRWGKPFSALLGAYLAQKRLGIPAIGGKDSMSGTFMNLDVPPTVVAFAVNTVDSRRVVSPEFKRAGSKVVLLPAPRDENELPCFKTLEKNFTAVYEAISSGAVLATHTVRNGGIAAAVSKMAFGNGIGMAFNGSTGAKQLFEPAYGSIILEIDEEADPGRLLGPAEHLLLGHTVEQASISTGGVEIPLQEAFRAWESPLENIFPTRAEPLPAAPPKTSYEGRSTLRPRAWAGPGSDAGPGANAGSRTEAESGTEGGSGTEARAVDSETATGESAGRSTGAGPGAGPARPRIFIPVFPGTNCEYDTVRAFQKAGGLPETLVIKNLTPADVESSIAAIAAAIDRSQVIMIPGGFSAGDEPDGSGKFIAVMFRNPRIKEAVMKLLEERDGLILGICNGFQALIKLGLVPYGEFREPTETSPTITYNSIGRHVSQMVVTRVASTLSPWFSNVQAGDLYTLAVSHGEGRFVAAEEEIEVLFQKGQVATQYADLDGNPARETAFNPNGSMAAVEGITSPDGRILGKMAHSERIGDRVSVNIPGQKDQRLFEAGVAYFR